MQHPISCDNLGKIDCGAARLIIDKAIGEALADLEDRGTQDRKPRHVDIRLELGLMENGLVVAHVEAAPRVPRRRTAPTVGMLKHKDGGTSCLFQEYAPEGPAQRTIDEIENQPKAQGV
jgi:hypothetical protein